jgi:glycerol-3-phosphate dehydrogenase (NAD(P)+)
VARFHVVGATSWGVTLACLLARNGHDVLLLTRDEREAGAVRVQRGIARLPGAVLPESVSVAVTDVVTSEPGGTLIAVPARAVLATAATLRCAGPLLSATKGLTEDGGRISASLLRQFPDKPVAALSGPNLSHEIVAGLPAAAVVACADPETARLWQAALSGPTFRVYTSNDAVGVELGGALKNVIAIAAGAAWGLGLGTNAVAAVMTRGLAEMTRLGVALGADPLTFQGLAGIGDLSATCFSDLSRNRRLGELLAAGVPAADAIARIGEAVEGVATAPVALALARQCRVETPITEAVTAVLEGRQNVARAMSELLARPPARES